MDKNFMDKFTFIFGVIQTLLLLLGVVIGFVYIVSFAYKFGVLDERVSILEDQNPILPVKVNVDNQ